MSNISLQKSELLMIFVILINSQLKYFFAYSSSSVYSVVVVRLSVHIHFNMGLSPGDC